MQVKYYAKLARGLHLCVCIVDKSVLTDVDNLFLPTIKVKAIFDTSVFNPSIFGLKTS